MDDFKDFTRFEDFEEEKSGVIKSSETDEIRATGLAKEGLKRKGRQWTEKKMLKHHPEYVTIIPKLVRYDKETRWVESKGITTKKTSRLIKRLLYGSLVFVILLLAVTFTINSLNHLMNPLKKLSSQQWQSTNTDLKKQKKTSTNYKNQIKRKTKSSEASNKPVKKDPVKEEQTIYEFIMEGVE